MIPMGGSATRTLAKSSPSKRGWTLRQMILGMLLVILAIFGAYAFVLFVLLRSR